MFGAPTLHSVVLLVIILTGIFLFLLGYTFWTRAKKKYWEEYGQKFRAMFVPLIFEYIETAERRRDADDVIKKVTRRAKDIELFIAVVDEMSEILHGSDLQKLNWLIKHPLFESYYYKKLNSALRNDQLVGCIYYSNSGNFKQKAARRLIKLSTSNDIKIAYGATKAIQNSANNRIRIKSLIDFFKRPDTTTLMVGELLHLYHLNSERMYTTSEHSLNRLLLDREILKEKKGIVIEYIAHHNLYEYSTFLNHYLQKILYRPENKALIKSLISTLGILKVEEAGQLIRNYSVYPDPSLRLCCVEALNELGGDENLLFVTEMLMDMEFDIRKQIIQTLVKNSDNGHLYLENFMQTYLKFPAKVLTTGSPPKDLHIYIKKLRSIMNGIRITFANSKKQQKKLSA